MRRILGTRPAHGFAGALVDNELQRCGQRGLDGGAVDLTVRLHGMRVARVELRARVEHRQIEAGASTSLLKSILPPQRQGGRELTSSTSREGATDMMPRNGASGTSMSSENSATLRLVSSLMIFGAGAERRPGNTPLVGPELFTPYGTRSSRLWMRTSSMSPGAAPST